MTHPLLKKAVFKLDLETKSIERLDNSEPLTLHLFSDKKAIVSIDSLPDNSLIFGNELVAISKADLQDEIEINTLTKNIHLIFID